MIDPAGLCYHRELLEIIRSQYPGRDPEKVLLEKFANVADPTFAFLVRWGPELMGMCTAVAAIFTGNPYSGASQLFSRIWAFCRDLASDSARDLASPKGILEKMWDFLVSIAGKAKWSLLWNPWFVAGAIAVAGVVWMIYRAYRA